MADENKKEDMRIDLESLNIVLNAHAEKTLNFTEKYDRNLYDDIKKREVFLNEQFGQKKVIVTDYDEKLHRNSKAAENLYKSKASRHKAQVDHTTAIYRAHQFAKNANLRYLTDGDIKKAVNRKRNYKLMSQHLNVSKKHKSHSQLIKVKKDLNEQQKKQLRKEQKRSMVQFELVERNFVNGLKQELPLAITQSTIRNLSEFAEGQKDAEDMIPDIVVETSRDLLIQRVDDTARGLTKAGLSSVKNSLIKKAGKDGAKIIISNVTTKTLDFVIKNLDPIVDFGIMIAGDVVRFASGEIKADELAVDAAAVAATLVITNEVMAALSGVLGITGGPLGGAIGYVVGFVVSSIVSRAVMDYKVTRDMRKRDERLFDLAAEAVQVLEKKRAELRAIVEKHCEDWDKTCEQGFLIIEKAALDNNAEDFAKGLSEIMSLFGRKSAFTSVDDVTKYLGTGKEWVF